MNSSGDVDHLLQGWGPTATLAKKQLVLSAFLSFNRNQNQWSSNWLKVSDGFSSDMPNSKNAISSLLPLCNVLIDLGGLSENFVEHSYLWKCDSVQLEWPQASQDTCLLTSTLSLSLSGKRSTFLHEKCSWKMTRIPPSEVDFHKLPFSVFHFHPWSLWIFIPPNEWTCTGSSNILINSVYYYSKSYPCGHKSSLQNCGAFFPLRYNLNRMLC